MKTRADILSVVTALEVQISALPMDYGLRRKLYEDEVAKILDSADPTQRWSIFCALDSMAIRLGVAEYL